MKQANDSAQTVVTPSWRAFHVYYVAIFLCWFGPHLNPEFARQLWLSPRIGLVLGIILAAGVVYMKWSQEYRITLEGVERIRRYPPEKEKLRWEEVARLEVQRGLTHTLLDVGNIVVMPRDGARQAIVLSGVRAPKHIRDFMEHLRQ